MLISDTQKDRTLSVGRRKKPDRSRRSVRFDNKALAMLQIYAERNGLDVTSALNQLLLTHLRAMGLEPEAEEIINKLRQDEDGESAQ
jgi:hypothetical protein